MPGTARIARGSGEGALSPDLARLVALQAVDSDIHALQGQLETLPRQEAETAARVRRARAAVTEFESSVQRLTLERREGEKEVDSLADQERKFQSRTAAVKTNEELWALQKEIRGVQEKRSAKETAVLEAVGAAPPPGYLRMPLSEVLKDD